MCQCDRSVSSCASPFRAGLHEWRSVLRVGFAAIRTGRPRLPERAGGLAGRQAGRQAGGCLDIATCGMNLPDCRGLRPILHVIRKVAKFNLLKQQSNGMGVYGLIRKHWISLLHFAYQASWIVNKVTWYQITTGRPHRAKLGRVAVSAASSASFNAYRREICLPSVSQPQLGRYRG